MNRKRRSDVWKYFRESETDASIVKCDLCKAFVSRGGKSSKSYTTTNMHSHLKNCHSLQQHLGATSPKRASGEDRRPAEDEDPDDEGLLSQDPGSFSIFTPAPRNRSTSVLSESGPSTAPSTPSSSDLMRRDSFPSVSSASAATSSNTSLSQSPTPRPRLLQPSLQEAFTRKLGFGDCHPKAIEITNVIGEMIAMDAQPFSMVENLGFRRLVKRLEPRYRIPGRKYFSSVVVPNLYKSSKAEVQALLASAVTINITTDMWSSTAGDDYLSLTCHFLTEHFEMIHISLDVLPFTFESHSAVNISNFLSDTFEEWEISDKINVIVRDNARNIVAALENGNFEHIPCLAHTLQLVIKDGCLNHEQVSNLLATCRRIVGHFKHSVKANKVLRRAQKALGIKEHKMIQDEPTRWNSSYEMMNRLYEQRRALALASQDVQKLPVELTGMQWNMIEELISILKIFLDATKAVSSANASVSEVIPIVNGISAALMKRNTNSENRLLFQGMKNDLLASIKLRYGNCEKNAKYAVASLLDPRFKNKIFTDQENISSAIAKIRMEISCHEECSTSVAPQHETASASSLNPLWSLYAEVMEKNTENQYVAPPYTNSELNMYLSEPLMSPSGNIFQYWNTSCFKSLKKVAMKYLPVPPASVYSERLFSTAGIICDRKRSRLDPDKVRMLVFLNKNLQLKYQELKATQPE